MAVGRRAQMALVALLLASHLPFFVLHLVNLWRYRPHYEFVPILLAAFAWLVWKRWPDETVHTRTSWLTAWLMLLLGLACLAASVVLFSPWVGAVATVFSVGGLLLAVRRARCIWPIADRVAVAVASDPAAISVGRSTDSSAPGPDGPFQQHASGDRERASSACWECVPSAGSRDVRGRGLQRHQQPTGADCRECAAGDSAAPGLAPCHPADRRIRLLVGGCEHRPRDVDCAGCCAMGHRPVRRLAAPGFGTRVGFGGRSVIAQHRSATGGPVRVDSGLPTGPGR